MFGNVAEFTDSDFRPKPLDGEDPNFRYVESHSILKMAGGFIKRRLVGTAGEMDEQEEKYYGKAIRGESFNFSFAEPPRPETKEKINATTIDGIIDIVKTSVDIENNNPLWRNFRISTRGHYLPNTTDKKMFDVGFRLVRIANNKRATVHQHRRFSLKNALTAKKEKAANADQPTTGLTPDEEQKENDTTSTNAPAKRPQMLTSDFNTTVNTNSSITDEDLAQEADDQVEEKDGQDKKNKQSSSQDTPKENF